MITPKVAEPTPREEVEAYELVALRDGETCVFGAADCEGAIQRDHRQNRSQGGRTTLEDLQLLCAKHHHWKTHHSEQAWAEGWGVPGWAEPAAYPARRVIRTVYGLRVIWCLYRPTLGDDGLGFVEITRREAERRIAEGRLYREVTA